MAEKDQFKGSSIVLPDGGSCTVQAGGATVYVVASDTTVPTSAEGATAAEGTPSAGASQLAAAMSPELSRSMVPPAAPGVGAARASGAPRAVPPPLPVMSAARDLDPPRHHGDEDGSHPTPPPAAVVPPVGTNGSDGGERGKWFFPLLAILLLLLLAALWTLLWPDNGFGGGATVKQVEVVNTSPIPVEVVSPPSLVLPPPIGCEGTGDDSNQCTTDKCVVQDSDQLKWEHIPLLAGTACDDGKPETVKDQCSVNSAGKVICAGKPKLVKKLENPPLILPNYRWVECSGGDCEPPPPPVSPDPAATANP